MHVLWEMTTDLMFLGGRNDKHCWSAAQTKAEMRNSEWIDESDTDVKQAVNHAYIFSAYVYVHVHYNQSSSAFITCNINSMMVILFAM